jgi:hypothetical protein
MHLLYISIFQMISVGLLIPKGETLQVIDYRIGTKNVAYRHVQWRITVKVAL